MVSVNSVSNSVVADKKMGFTEYANKLNAMIPDKTSDIQQKTKAIGIKTALLSHPECPEETKKALMKEIEIIQGEIDKIRQLNKSTKPVAPVNNASFMGLDLLKQVNSRS
jgi:hypothetical protein